MLFYSRTVFRNIASVERAMFPLGTAEKEGIMHRRFLILLLESYNR